MGEIATNYGIARNFPTIPETERFSKALSALEKIGGSVTAENVGRKVNELAAQFRSDYGGGNKIAASSKFLWFWHQSPIVIYDGNAFTYISKSCGRTIHEHEYKEYRNEWLEQFDRSEPDIRSACDKLVRIKKFLLDEYIANGQLERVIKERWFHERVFDKFLWWHGGLLLAKAKR
jgi:hypothetical protein